VWLSPRCEPVQTRPGGASDRGCPPAHRGPKLI
jgi:hypothetical protein